MRESAILNTNDPKLCPICGRILAEPINRHHLIPLSKGGRDTTTIAMHVICHNKIHTVFTETELKRYYYTIERLIAHPEMMKFIKWVQKKEPEFFDRSVKKK